MVEYEIFILKSDTQKPMVLQVRHRNDDEVLLWARKYAEGRAFQIWRGMDCIHDEEAWPGTQHAA